eukprot:TRINITY_DN28118_c0_g1_i1.p1 TRINITY_DN28118_c0_g1~~TRINITY_DN28118_c0_g1_i1.p1  ORF type:complete len:268 (-),score=62.90 TRINITY_DN28118_c0_g1_i1:10-813(-)
MGQSFNSKAVRTLGSVIRHPSLAVPHLALTNIAQLDFAALKAMGIRGIIFDKDNTLTAPYVEELHPAISDGFRRCQSQFGGSICVMSNSAGTGDDVNFESAIKIETGLGIPVLRHREKKPGGLPEVLAFFRERCADEGIEARDLCVIGDRLLTDVVFGNLHGMLTVHTKPLTLQGDNKVALVARYIESRIFFNIVQARFSVGAPQHCLSGSLQQLELKNGDAKEQASENERQSLLQPGAASDQHSQKDKIPAEEKVSSSAKQEKKLQ